MGPSWYWMPDVFERYFSCLGKSLSSYYTLKRLDPSYRVYFSDGPMDVPANYEELRRLFEQIEKAVQTNSTNLSGKRRISTMSVSINWFINPGAR